MGIPIEDGFQIINVSEIVRQEITTQTGVKGSKIEQYDDDDGSQNQSRRILNRFACIGSLYGQTVFWSGLLNVFYHREDSLHIQILSRI